MRERMLASSPHSSSAGVESPEAHPAQNECKNCGRVLWQHFNPVFDLTMKREMQPATGTRNNITKRRRGDAKDGDERMTEKERRSLPGSRVAVVVAAAAAAVLGCGCPLLVEGFKASPTVPAGVGYTAKGTRRPGSCVGGERSALDRGSGDAGRGWSEGVTHVAGGRIRGLSMRVEKWTGFQRSLRVPFYGPFSPAPNPDLTSSPHSAQPLAFAKVSRLSSFGRSTRLKAFPNDQQSLVGDGSVPGPFCGPFQPFTEAQHQEQHPTCPASSAPRGRSSLVRLSAHPSKDGSGEPTGANPAINPASRGSEVIRLAAAVGGSGGEDGSSSSLGRHGAGSRNGIDGASPMSRPSPFRWFGRTLIGRVALGRRGGFGSRRGWGFRGGSARRVASGGSGEDEAGGTAVREEAWNGHELNGDEDLSSGWNLSGWTNEGRRGSRERRDGGGPGLNWLRGPDSGNRDVGSGERVSWADKGGGWADELHTRTVAKIHTLMGREDKAEEMELNLIRDPYLLGDASWVPESVDETAEWRRLEAHRKRIGEKHLKDVMQDTERSLALSAEYEGTILDFSRMNVSQLTMKLLMDLAKRQGLKEKILAMYEGEKINNTEDRAVLHVALRMNRDDAPIMVDGVNVVEQVHQTLDQVKAFSEAVRSGRQRGATKRHIRNIVAVGIGGSYLGPEFVHEAFKTQEYSGREQAELYRLRFLSNVDPVDVRRTLYDLDPEETLVVVISKTFTTAETMLNARTARQWLWDAMGKDPAVVEKHMAACASESAMKLVVDFGIPEDRLFRLWDWVGGRYSVCSSVGALPLSLKYGFQQFENFLAGARSMDKHFLHAPFEKNLPVLMGLLGVWNMSFMGYKTRTILPYAEALLKFPAHIQQLAMESNGKRVTKSGKRVKYDIGEVDFGEPGTNGQHSFFQLLHMGQICPAEFIGFIESQHPLHVEGEPICSHDELMANFFAQPDALAIGKGKQELKREGCRQDLIPHRTFDGNRPSLSLLVPKVNSYHLGQMLALYEHRTAVEGFMWDINSFDQWGVELGKSLATSVREKMQKFREDGQKTPTGLNPSTQRLMSRYLQQSDTFVRKVGNINHKSKNMEKESS